MHRQALEYLSEWRGRPSRKPLVLRGARQVGKTHLVRAFAREAFENLVEVNLERDPALEEIFSGGHPAQTLRMLELHGGVEIRPGATLLFLDEIQAAPSVLSSLRYFHEEAPELHVVAAGSLLETVLETTGHPMPVGRIEYLHLGPMTFEEFLLAAGEDGFVQFLREFAPEDTIADAIHARLMALLREYLVIGGLPEVVAAHVSGSSARQCDMIKQSILSTYRDDFGKYGQRVRHDRLAKVFRQLPRLVGSRLKYVLIDPHERAKDLDRALRQLCLARVAHRVQHTSGNGVPLAAEANERKFKILFLDVGLMVRELGLNLLDLERAGDPLLVNEGAVCEQLVGQHLLYSREEYEEPELHFWAREKPSSTAEVDYLISDGAEIVPIEVKAGKTGTLKSLQLFLREKNRRLGVRLNSAPPSLLDAETRLPGGGSVSFRLLSLPLYLVGQVRRLARAARGD